MAGSIKGMIQFLSGMMTSQESKPAWGHTLTLASLVTGRALPFSHLQVLSHGRTMTHKGGMAPCALHATWQWSPGALAWPRRTFFHAKRQLCERNRGRRFGVGASALGFFSSSFRLSAGQTSASKMPHPLSGSPSQVPVAPTPAEGQGEERD